RGSSGRRGAAVTLADPLSRSAPAAITRGDPIVDPSGPLASPQEGWLDGGETGESDGVTGGAAWSVSARSHRVTKIWSWCSRRVRLPGDSEADRALSDWAATGPVATGPVAMGPVALGGVATAGVVVDGVAWGSVVAGFIAAGCVAGACCAES
ncbi:MAG: hypothetical protein WCD11_08080, partial [Solirubrobacteraceae bacterium]